MVKVIRHGNLQTPKDITCPNCNAGLQYIPSEVSDGEISCPECRYSFSVSGKKKKKCDVCGGSGRNPYYHPHVGGSSPECPSCG